MILKKLESRMFDLLTRNAYADSKSAQLLSNMLHGSISSLSTPYSDESRIINVAEKSNRLIYFVGRDGVGLICLRSENK